MDIGLLILLGVNAIFVAASGLALVGTRMFHAPRWGQRTSLQGRER
jgi:hypothetical protein